MLLKLGKEAQIQYAIKYQISRLSLSNMAKNEAHAKISVFAESTPPHDKDERTHLLFLSLLFTLPTKISQISDMYQYEVPNSKKSLMHIFGSARRL